MKVHYNTASYPGIGAGSKSITADVDLMPILKDNLSEQTNKSQEGLIIVGLTLVTDTPTFIKINDGGYVELAELPNGKFGVSIQNIRIKKMVLSATAEVSILTYYYL